MAKIHVRIKAIIFISKCKLSRNRSVRSLGYFKISKLDEKKVRIYVFVAAEPLSSTITVSFL
jgi:hypothetical protein